jgi:replicative DNA helicase
MSGASTDSVGHELPQNIDAENALIGAMIKDRFGRETAEDAGITAAMFHRPSNRVLFEELRRMDAEGVGVDEQSLLDRLRAAKTLKAAGDTLNVMTLAERCPSVANSAAYAAEVIAVATVRGLVTTGHEIARLGYERGGSPSELVARAGELVAGIVDGTPGDADEFGDNATLLEQMFEEWGTLHKQGRAPGLKTGLPELDATWGGLLPGTLTVIAGRPGMGKSALMMQIAGTIAAQGGRVAAYSLEMSRKEILGRMVSAESGVDGRRLSRTVPLDCDFDPLMDAVATLKDMTRTLLIRERPGLSPAQLRTSARRVKRRHGLDLVVVDYLQLMEAGSRRNGRDSNRTEDVSHISRQLKAMAMELGVPVIVASQLNRMVEQRTDKMPMLSDLRESGAIEQDADAVLFVMRPSVYWPDDTEVEGLVHVVCAKNRGGPTGKIELGFDAPRTRFLDSPPPAQPKRFYAGGAVA